MTPRVPNERRYVDEGSRNVGHERSGSTFVYGLCSGRSRENRFHDCMIALVSGKLTVNWWESHIWADGAVYNEVFVD